MKNAHARWLLSTPLVALVALTGCGGSTSNTAATNPSSPTTTAMMAGATTPAAGTAPTATTAVADKGRIIEVSMVDNKFKPDTFAITKGETITFRVKNDGVVVHEAVLGDEAGQKIHGDDLADDGVHSHKAGLHGPAAQNMQPGATADLTYKFDTPGVWFMGCHIPGHYESGMKATITTT